MPTNPSTPRPQLQTLVKSPQFVWWLGHVTLLVCSALYLPYSLTLNSKSGSIWYSGAFLGALVSYGVVAYKSFPEIKFEAQFLQSIFVEENVQYLLLAFFWWRSAPRLVALIPYAVYALFNALNYARINLMPESALALKIKSWTEQNHGQAMVLVAYVEIIGVMGTLVLQALTFQGSLLWPIAYAFFLRFRYFFSIHTRAAFAVLRARLDAKVVGNPKIPPKAIMAYEIARGAVIRFGMAAVKPPTASQ